MARTAGYSVYQSIVQTRDTPHPNFYIGAGKLEEIKPLIQGGTIKLVVVDDELTPNQSKVLESELNVKVIDRTGLILDIFAKNARTYEAQLQVELAQLDYLYPRLTRLWTHLSRLGGGIGTRGPGEKQLEVDKRQIKVRMNTIRHKLSKIKSHREVLRTRRANVPSLSAAIIGYTNAGKSTLLNHLTNAQVLAQDKLFATLDPTTKRLRLPNNDTLLITDTVGFIQKLPHQLVSSFRATLEEVLAADFLLHVVDISHPKHVIFIETAHSILKDLHAQDIPQLYIFNKCDQIADMQTIQDTLNKYQPHVVVSALTGLYIPDLLIAISKLLEPYRSTFTFHLPFSKMGLQPIIHEVGDIHQETFTDEGVVIEATLQTIIAEKILSELYEKE